MAIYPDNRIVNDPLKISPSQHCRVLKVQQISNQEGKRRKDKPTSMLNLDIM